MRMFQPESSNRIVPKQSHVPVICHLPSRPIGGSVVPKLGGFARVESRGALLEESGDRLTSVR
jgi:hypothetical protein